MPVATVTGFLDALGDLPFLTAEQREQLPALHRQFTDLKALAQDLEVPEGMGVILRTAGANRTKAEIKRDFEYLIRLWETVRDLTLKSTAPTLVMDNELA